MSEKLYKAVSPFACRKMRHFKGRDVPEVIFIRRLTRGVFRKLLNAGGIVAVDSEAEAEAKKAATAQKATAKKKVAKKKVVQMGSPRGNARKK